MSWQTAYVPGSTPDGKAIISVLAKRTYTIAHGEVASESQRQLPLLDADVFADPRNMQYSEVLAESDLAAWKPFTDVVVAGAACAGRGRKAYHLDCSVQVDELAKIVRVYGNRRARLGPFRKLQLCDPEPFESIGLGYCRAFGGVTRTRKGTLFSYFPNPIGCGFRIAGGMDRSAPIRIPNLEHPGSPVTAETMEVRRFEDWRRAPKPASLGWTRRNFFPRYTFSGVLPEYLPGAGDLVDQESDSVPSMKGVEVPRMDFRFFQGASEGLWGGPLHGGELVRLTYLDHDHPTFEFELPSETPALAADVGDGPCDLEPVLQTVAMDKITDTMTMVWRGSVEYGGYDELARVRVLEAETAHS